MTADKAVDGILYDNTDSEYAHTDGGQTVSQWWMVDLGGPHNITEIYLHGRFGQCRFGVIGEFCEHVRPMGIQSNCLGLLNHQSVCCT